MDFADSATGVAGVHLSRVELSIGGLDVLRFANYDHAFPRHAHDHYTVGVFDVDNGSLRYRNAKWVAADGSVLAVAADEVHAAEPARGTGWTYRVFYPSISLVALAIDDEPRAASTVFPAPIIDDPSLAGALLRLHEDLVAGTHGLAVEEQLLASLRWLLARHSAARTTRRTPASAARAVELARDYIDTHFAEAVKLAPLAALCETSPFHLIRSFRQIVGLPPHAYLTQVRANRARDMLLRGESVCATAHLCGFCDQSHLTRTFKRLFGMTPGAYIDAHRPRARGA